jgi:hypothetical protein
MLLAAGAFKSFILFLGPFLVVASYSFIIIIIIIIATGYT